VSKKTRNGLYFDKNSLLRHFSMIYWKEKRNYVDMKKLISTLLFTLLAVASVSARAENITLEEPGNAQPVSRGVYGELNGGPALLNSIFLYNGTTFNGGGVNANVGYQFNHYFALETGYTHYFVEDGVNSYDMALKSILPLGTSQRFKLFFKFGPAYVRKEKENNFLLYGGIGAGYSITSHLTANVQLQGDTVALVSIALLSAGFSYHF
jgi:hypothetical protein